MRSVVVVGVCGASGSGKSTLAEELADSFDSPILPISADTYFKSTKVRCCYGIVSKCHEMPESVDQRLLARDLRELVELLKMVDCMPSVTLKKCLNRSDRVGKPLGDKQVVLVVEGFVLLAELKLVELCDHLVWLECDEETGCQRRFNRRMLKKETKLDPAAEFTKFQSFYSHVWHHHVNLIPVFEESMVGRSCIKLDSRAAPEEVYRKAFRDLQAAIESTAGAVPLVPVRASQQVVKVCEAEVVQPQEVKAPVQRRWGRASDSASASAQKLSKGSILPPELEEHTGLLKRNVRVHWQSAPGQDRWTEGILRQAQGRKSVKVLTDKGDVELIPAAAVLSIVALDGKGAEVKVAKAKAKKKAKDDSDSDEPPAKTKAKAKKAKDDSDDEPPAKAKAKKKAKDDSDDEPPAKTKAKKKAKDDSDDETPAKTKSKKKAKDDSDDEPPAKTKAEKKAKDDSDSDSNKPSPPKTKSKKKPKDDSDSDEPAAKTKAKKKAKDDSDDEPPAKTKTKKKAKDDSDYEPPAKTKAKKKAKADSDSDEPPAKTKAKKKAKDDSDSDKPKPKAAEVTSQVHDDQRPLHPPCSAEVLFSDLQQSAWSPISKMEQSDTVQPYIFDMETGDPDDVLTLLFLCSNPAVQLRAVTITPGSEEQVALVQWILNEVGMPDVRIGAQAWPTNAKKGCISGRFYENFGFLKKGKLICEPADRVLLECCDESVTLVTGAALHNLGAVLDVDGFELGRWVAQGGFAGEGVVPRHLQMRKFVGKVTCPTYNFNGNPAAANAALASSCIKHRLLVSKNVCHRAVYDEKWHAALGAVVKSLEQGGDGKVPSSGRRFAALSLMHKCMGNYMRHRGEKKLHDPLALAAALDESVCQFAEVQVFCKNGEWGSRIYPGSGTWISIDYDPAKFQSVLLCEHLL